jgi:hypothetical protein
MSNLNAKTFYNCNVKNTKEKGMENVSVFLDAVFLD